MLRKIFIVLILMFLLVSLALTSSSILDDNVEISYDDYKLDYMQYNLGGERLSEECAELLAKRNP